MGAHTVRLSRQIGAAWIYGNKSGITRIKDLLHKCNLTISALSCHGNPLHTNEAIASQHQNDLNKPCLSQDSLASTLW
ncbi:hypothetical protein CBW46_013310 [Paenibacillus xerothermodurans]|uniref:Uncharacterized protein n=1 Tax=Paenibacillus xerothermodurans TaxID=1977292 RepID=A0A2W1NAZ9_PAEXE|nr:hypothetical protein CBW46_013310 [Paenibacillus xerothermodurans]